MLKFFKCTFINISLYRSRPYSLSTTFPRREFHESDMQQTLRELDLTPSAALLIIPIAGTGMISAINFYFYFVCAFQNIFFH